jgi:hypothetical protein
MASTCWATATTMKRVASQVSPGAGSAGPGGGTGGVAPVATSMKPRSTCGATSCKAMLPTSKAPRAATHHF